MNLPAVRAAVSSPAEHGRSAEQFHRAEVLEPARTKPNKSVIAAVNLSFFTIRLSLSYCFSLAFSSSPLTIHHSFC